MTVPLNFEEAVFGVDKEIEFEREETCSRCTVQVQNLALAG